MSVRVTAGRPPRKTTALAPAASRVPTTLSPEEADLNASAVDTFLAVVGGRAQLTDVLTVADSSSEIGKITNLLLDPRYATWSLRRICTMAGVTIADLLTAYRKALLVRKQIEATHVIADKIIPVVVDVMDKALTDPTVERHKLALELAQLTEKKGGGIVMQQNTIAAGAVGSSLGGLEQLQQAVGDLLFAPRRRRGHNDTEIVRDVPPEPRTPFTEEEEPPLPFGDPSPRGDPEAPRTRRPWEPGMPEEDRTDDTDDADDDPGAANADA